MSLQLERITAVCEALGLGGVACQYDALAQMSMITSMEPFRDRFIGATLGSV